MTDELRDMARELISQIDREAIFGSEDFGLHYELAEPIIHAALLRAKEAGEREERGRCAAVARDQLDCGSDWNNACQRIAAIILRPRQHTGERVMGEPNYRRERIERLLHELRYEVERGMLEREIDETIGFRWVVPVSQRIPDGVVLCEFRTRPAPTYESIAFGDEGRQPRLRVIK